jgi:hypothetical protein
MPEEINLTAAPSSCQKQELHDCLHRAAVNGLQASPGMRRTHNLHAMLSQLQLAVDRQTLTEGVTWTRIQTYIDMWLSSGTTDGVNTGGVSSCTTQPTHQVTIVCESLCRSTPAYQRSLHVRLFSCYSGTLGRRLAAIRGCCT